MVFSEQVLWDEKLTELCTMAQEQGTHTVVMSPGKQVTGKNLIVSCLAPDGNKLAETGNAASLVLEGAYGELDMLFTGDVEGEGEEFLEIVHPKLAVISAGRDNRYGHPYKETLDKLEKIGTAVLNTAESGAVILKTDGKDVVNLKIIQYNRFYEKFE